MKISSTMNALVPLLMMAAGGLAGMFTGWAAPEKPVLRNVLIQARQYAFNPPILRVNRNDTLRIQLLSLDVVHGFYLEGYNLDAKITPNQQTFQLKQPLTENSWKEAEEIILVVDRVGKFRYRCSQTCGSMHPFMQGELIVEPNLPYRAGVGSVLGLCLGMVWILSKKRGKEEDRIEGNGDPG